MHIFLGGGGVNKSFFRTDPIYKLAHTIKNIIKKWISITLGGNGDDELMKVLIAEIKWCRFLVFAIDLIGDFSVDSPTVIF